MSFFQRRTTDPTIAFRCPERLRGVIAEPYKAARALPRWFRELKADLPHGSTEFPGGTAKKCAPLLDVFNAGYVIPLPVAVAVNATEDHELNFNWRTNGFFGAVDTHGSAQTGNLETPGGTYKWNNPWSIVTPPGYSCLFITPVNRPDLPFECFSAIVDTDTYQNQVNFPFLWKRFPYDGVLDAGQPMIQVIPFRRESWSHDVEYLGPEASRALEREGMRVNAVRSQYRREARHTKSW